MRGDNVYIEKHADTVIVATTDDGAVTAHTFRNMSPETLGLLMADMTAALTRDEGSVEDTLTGWALTHEAP